LIRFHFDKRLLQSQMPCHFECRHSRVGGNPVSLRLLLKVAGSPPSRGRRAFLPIDVGMERTRHVRIRVTSAARVDAHKKAPHGCAAPEG
jgi:hypothetical protein